MIGCGHVGKTVIRGLLANDVDPELITISTRRPEDAVASLGDSLTIVDDNIGVASKSTVIFVCCLPSQLNGVASEVRSHLKKGT